MSERKGLFNSCLLNGNDSMMWIILLVVLVFFLSNNGTSDC